MIRCVRGVLRGHPGPLLLCVGQPSTVRERGTIRTWPYGQKWTCPVGC
ncbi:hypothetical protein T261_05339 [Streptomyces lydicus]|nr:hypothetical protein T261_05339 [Streptomyces lydicus]